MDVEYVAFDSMGVEGSCFVFESGNDSIIVDPGIAIEPDSFPLSESRRMYLKGQYLRKVKKRAKKADIALLSHYHYDHFTKKPDRKLYGNKRLMVKSPDQYIDEEQQERASKLLDEIEPMSSRLDYIDNQSFYFDSFRVKFAEPGWHGVEGTELGYVVPMVFHENESDRKLLYSSDVDGLLDQELFDWIVGQDPDEIILNGPPTYMLDFVLDYQDFARGVLNLRRLIELVDPEKIILDHHLLRDYRYKDLYYSAYELAEERGVTMRSAAEENGERPKVIEAYGENGPTKWNEWPKPSVKDLKRLAEGKPPEQVLG